MNKNMLTGDQLKVIEDNMRKWAEQARESPAQPSRRSRRHTKPGKHTRISKTSDGRKFTWQETKPLPEDVKAKNRKRRKAAKQQKRKK